MSLLTPKSRILGVSAAFGTVSILWLSATVMGLVSGALSSPLVGLVLLALSAGPALYALSKRREALSTESTTLTTRSAQPSAIPRALSPDAPRSRIFEPNGEVHDNNKGRAQGAPRVYRASVTPQREISYDHFELPDDFVVEPNNFQGNEGRLAGADFSFDEEGPADIELMKPSAGASELTGSQQRKSLMTVVEMEA